MAFVEEVPEEEIEEYIDSCTTEPTTDENLNDRNLTGEDGIPPTFYVMLIFHQAFAEFMVNDNFKFFMQNDPYFGDNTFGNVARLCPERIYVMVQQLKQLKEGWGDMAEFAEYAELVEKVPLKNDVPQGEVHREFFYEMVDKFIKEFESSLSKHVLRPWKDEMRLYCILGGDKTLAKEFAKMLCWYDGIESPPDPESLADSYQLFPSGNVTLGDHHTMSAEKGPVELNIKDSMEYLTGDKTHEVWRRMLDGRFVKNHWDLITKFAMADEEVELFDKTEDGKYS